MIFVLKMMAREMRASWKRLLFFFVCVAVGVGSIVMLRSVIQNVRGALVGEAKALTAADVVLRTSRPWTDRARRLLETRIIEYPEIAATETVETATMVRPADRSKAVARVVELQAVTRGYPYYGRVVLQGGQPYSHLLMQGRAALARPELLTQLGVGVGDRILIGEAEFTVAGVITAEPGRRVGLFSFGPRVMIHLDDLEKTGLLATGSRARYEYLFRVPEPVIDPFMAQLGEDFVDEFVSVRSYRRREDRIGEDFDRAENYLSLVGFVILILGGIGVWSVTRVFIQQKIRSIAILKCVGATSGQILTMYVLQVLALGFVGSVLGVLLAAGAIAATPRDVVPELSDVAYGVTGSAVGQGLGIGLVVSLLFALAPLLEVRLIKPLLLLRQEASRSRARPSGWAGARAWLAERDWLRVVIVLLATLGLVVIATWQAASLEAGLYVCAGFAGVALTLHVVGRLLVRLVAPLATSAWFPLRHAVISLSRPGNQTRVILLAVGLGSFFMIGIQVLQSNLLREFDLRIGAYNTDMFLLDIQQDQVDGVRDFLEARAPTAPRVLPVLRARVVGVQGREVNLEGLEDVRGQGSLARDYVVTYRDHLEANETLLDGRLWAPDDAPAPEVSIEESVRERYNIDIGDVMRFDVLSRVVSVRVTSVREVDWNDPRNGGFMFVFRPEVFAGAPHTYIALLEAPVDPTARATMQRELVDRWPNISAVDMREILRTVQGVVDNVTLAITVVGAVALLSGALILVGAVAMTKFQRVYEAAIFKTLGATTRTIATMLVLEYGGLGVLAGLVGSLGAVVLSWALSRYLLDISWRFAPVENLVGIVLTAVGVGLVGVLASADVLRRKPLMTLRAE